MEVEYDVSNGSFNFDINEKYTVKINIYIYTKSLIYNWAASLQKQKMIQKIYILRSQC